ncbi:MAG: class II aldolase/adducin family protein [Alphaproteobacteria bacterium]
MGAEPLRKSLRNEVSPEEWALRVDLAALYRLVALYGWDDMILTHISLRLAGPQTHFLINPFGVLFDEMTASSLVKIDVDGRSVDPDTTDINYPGFIIHGALHMWREDARCVLHLHTPDGVAVAAQEHGLLPITQHAMMLYHDIAYHDYEGVVVDMDERERLVRDIGNKHCMILRNHGTLTLGRTCAEAFLRMYFLERACTMQVKALAGSAKIHKAAEEAVEKTFGRANMQLADAFPNKAWPALLRKLDRLNPGYRQ